jgi:hypothetical protein
MAPPDVAAQNGDMEHNYHTHNAAPLLMPVRFEFTHPTAIEVCIAGTVNDWHPNTNVMHSSDVGSWWKESSLASGAYEYWHVVDGQWMPDPLACGTVANPFGGKNSILNVATSPRAAHLADAASLPLINTNKPKTRKL